MQAVCLINAYAISFRPVTCISTCMHTYTDTLIFTFTYAHTHSLTSACIHTYTHRQTNMHTHTHTYTQHHMAREGDRVWSLLAEQQGYLYVCGDAKAMAKDVHKALVSIVQKHRQCSGTQVCMSGVCVRTCTCALLDVHCSGAQALMLGLCLLVCLFVCYLKLGLCLLVCLLVCYVKLGVFICVCYVKLGLFLLVCLFVCCVKFIICACHFVYYVWKYTCLGAFVREAI